MTLREIAEQYPHCPGKKVPPWALGCFRRQSITYYNGVVDQETEVWWLQSHGLTADLRIRPGLPDLKGKSYPSDCTVQELNTLIQVEGGLAETRWDGHLMSWENWTAFQLHDKWPEAGMLHRVGDCLIEFAPSGAYVEDWRLQPGSDGILVGLELIEESNCDTGEILYRGGGLIICGNHAALIRGRAEDIPPTLRLDEFPLDLLQVPEVRNAIFQFETSIASRSSEVEPYFIRHSTHPQRIGEVLLAEDGFEYEIHSNQIRQMFVENGIPRNRIFRIDTLETDVQISLETPVTSEGEEWFGRESSPLMPGQQAMKNNMERTMTHNLSPEPEIHL